MAFIWQSCGTVPVGREMLTEQLDSDTPIRNKTEINQWIKK